MQSFEQIQSFYKSLVENFSILSIDQKPKQDVEELIITGTPTSSELYIGILHRLVNKYPQLINTVEKKKELYDVLYPFALNHIKDAYNDYQFDHKESKLDITEFFNSIWMYQKTELCEYYLGNGGYILDGIKDMQLRKLLNQLK